MTDELFYLLLVTVLTGLIWIPYILDRIAVWGLADTVGYPENPKPQSAWARRLIKAHANAIENLVVFAALVLVAQEIFEKFKLACRDIEEVATAGDLPGDEIHFQVTSFEPQYLVYSASA